MKLSQKTKNIFKNFSTINNSVAVEKGNIITTLSNGRDILAKAILEEEFPVPFTIYELNKFISLNSVYENLEFKEEYVEFYNENEDNKVLYYYCDPAFILTVEKEKIETLEKVKTDFTFALTNDIVSLMQKTASIMKLNSLSIKADGEEINLEITQDRKLTKDTFLWKLGKIEEKFEVTIDIDNLKIISGDYNVFVTNKFLKFVSTDEKLTYWIALK